MAPLQALCDGRGILNGGQDRWKPPEQDNGCPIGSFRPTVQEGVEQPPGFIVGPWKQVAMRSGMTVIEGWPMKDWGP
jgi:hypothetical protein